MAGKYRRISDASIILYVKWAVNKYPSIESGGYSDVHIKSFGEILKNGDSIESEDIWRLLQRVSIELKSYGFEGAC